MDDTPSFSIDESPLIRGVHRFGFAVPVVFDSSSLPPEILERAKVDLRQWACQFPLANGFDPSRTKLLEWAGNDLDRMMASREATRSVLQHRDPNRRCAAVCVAMLFWGTRNEFFVADCLRLAFEDPDCTVRGAALRSLSLLSSHVLDRTGWLGSLFVMIRPGPSLPSDIFKKRETLEELEARLAKAKEQDRRKWEELAGAYAVQMESSQAAAELCLDHPEANIRRAAIQVLASKWKATELLAAKCETMLANDPDISVRCDAVGKLGWCYRESGNSRIGLLLANIVCDESAPMELRASAYWGLIRLRKAPQELLFRLVRRLPDFDLEFVNTFREISGP